MFDLYVVTDSQLAGGIPEHKIAEAAYRGNADAVQLRMKNADGRPMLEEAALIRELADEYCRFFFVNDRVDVAYASGADGVHLGQTDLPVSHARDILGEQAVIGVSVDDVEQAIQAEEDGADYIGVGSVFRTSTKPDAKQAVGLDMVMLVKEAVKVPVVAIGGINMGNIQDVIRAGADSAAVVSAVCSKPDMEKATHDLKDLILKVRPHVSRDAL
ncbi:MAG: thiamine phosphate synthase [Candidatus Methanomethylophilaceae archaeon]|nr:thiamine phosphate synthase [Candidatus Methanomethylophilaceae archaeon]